MQRSLPATAPALLTWLALLCAVGAAAAEPEFRLADGVDPQEEVRTLTVRIDVGAEGENLGQPLALDLGLGFPFWLYPVGQGEPRQRAKSSTSDDEGEGEDEPTPNDSNRNSQYSSFVVSLSSLLLSLLFVSNL